MAREWQAGLYNCVGRLKFVAPSKNETLSATQIHVDFVLLFLARNSIALRSSL